MMRNAESIAATILVRDNYRFVRLYYLTRLLVVVSGLLAMSVAANVWLVQRPPLYRYLMTYPNGHLMTLVPLNQANMSDEALAKWTVDAVTKIYTFDFRNYRTQLQDAQKLMTGTGWDWFQDAIKTSGNFDAVVKNKFVTTAVPTGPAVVTDHQLIDAGGEKRFLWTVEFPMLITYQSSTATTSQDLRLRVTVGRLPEYIAGAAGVGVRSILAK